MNVRHSDLIAIPVLLAMLASGAATASDDLETVEIDGLEWVTTTSGQDLRWPDAIEYCEQLELAGFGDWRLPSMDELQSLHDPDAPEGIRSPFRLDTCCAWSGESLEDREAEDGDETAGPAHRYHWGFMFDGGLEYYAVHVFEDGQALCVRDRQAAYQ